MARTGDHRGGDRRVWDVTTGGAHNKIYIVEEELPERKRTKKKSVMEEYQLPYRIGRTGFCERVT